MWVVLRKAPPLPFLPVDVHGKEVVVLAVFYAGDRAEDEKLIEPLRSFGDAWGEHVGIQPYIIAVKPEEVAFLLIHLLLTGILKPLTERVDRWNKAGNQFSKEYCIFKGIKAG